MSRNAGFGIVAELTQPVINQILAAYWSTLVQPITFQLPSGVQVGGETVSLQATIQLLAPSITLTQRPDNLIAVTASCGGILVAAVGGGAPVAAVVSLTTTIAVGITVLDQNKYFVPTLDLSNAVVSNLGINVAQGQPLPASVNQALSSPAVLGAMQAALRAVPQGLLALTTSTVPDSISSNGVTASFGNVVVVPMNGYLVIAADLIGYTQGNAGALVNLFTTPANGPVVLTYNQDGSSEIDYQFGTPGAECNIAATINGPALVNFLNGPVAAAIMAQSLPDDASINSVQFSLGSYQKPMDARFWPGLIVEVDASAYGLSGSITVDFGVYGEQPGSGTTSWLTQQSPATWNIRADNVVISVGFLAYLVLILLGAVISYVVPALIPIVIVALVTVIDGIIPGLIANFEAQAQAAINSGIQSGSGFGSSVDVVTFGTLPGTSTGSWSADTQGLVISQDGFDSYVSVAASGAVGASPSLALTGGTLTNPDPGLYLYTGVPQNWTATLTVPANGALSQFPYFLSLTDPSIHVAWSVAGTNVNGAPFASDLPITDAAALTKVIAFDPNSAEFAHNDGLSITATIYRLIDGQHWPIWSASVQTTIPDEVDVTRWYLQWNHRVYFSTQSNKGTARFGWTRNRCSVIHKTNRVQRCKNVETAVLAAERKGRSMTYFDTLPFPVADAAEHRRHVTCDYCFYGGPHGTQFTP